jgi:hypothetical protein
MAFEFPGSARLPRRAAWLALLIAGCALQAHAQTTPSSGDATASPAPATPAAAPAPVTPPGTTSTPPPTAPAASAASPASGAAAPPSATPPGASAADTAPTAAPAASPSETAPSASDTRALDEQTQSLKKDVVDLNRDLYVLEEELLYPANTQVAVFLSMDVGEFFALDSVTLKIDQKEVANYLYTPREVEALLRGGVHRLYIGNVKVGAHELVAFFSGKGPNNRDYKRGASIKFQKGISGHYLELKISDRQRKMQPEFEIKDWE